ncbi:MAG: glycosyl transferase family 90 [Pseudomonadota bacterium]
MDQVERFKKNLHRWKYYSSGALGQLVPRSFYRFQRERVLSKVDSLSLYERESIEERVGYYNRLSKPFSLSEEFVRNKNFRAKLHKSTYHFDLYEISRYFSEDCAFRMVFGDVTKVPNSPAFVKSRPVAPVEVNENSVLMKLDSIRHYYRVPDRRAYADKLPCAVWRGAAHQPHRKEFLEKFFHNSCCNVGATDKKPETVSYRKPLMSLEEQLKYKFIVSIEGNDVATNLKWIMSSNSLCFMRAPRYETWFMEGGLVPGRHYVCLKDDYSDLEEKMKYYLDNEDEALFIIENAKEHAEKFYDSEMERLISMLVFQKYINLLNW